MYHFKKNNIIKLGLVSIFLLFFLFLFTQNASRAASVSPDAIAVRVMPNSDHLSPLSWYQANIKNQGSPQTLTVDGYEAVRDGRTVYVNAANISGTDFYTNIYLLSFNQDVEQATQDIFSQLLSHWKFNTNISAEQKDNIRNDTKRLADLAEIKLALANYSKNHNSDFPSLAAGSYVVGKSMSVWPSWQATLGGELAITMPLDPVNKLGSCPQGYDTITCWDQTNKKFFGVPDNSQTYIYTYNGLRSYNVCGLMQSGYLTTLDQGACVGSAVGYKVICEDWVWTYKVDRAVVCSNQTITETSDCGNTRDILHGTRVDTVWTPTTPLSQVCTNQIVTETGDCGATRNITHGTRVDTVWTPNVNPATVCTTQIVTETGDCGATRNITHGTKTDTVWTPNVNPATVCTTQTITETGDCGHTRNTLYGTKVCMQTVNCVAKPNYTDWNTSGTVLQTWNGSVWQPSNSSSYDIIAGTCKYKCQSGYELSGSICVASCAPNCSGKNCGNDGCGGSCGTCGSAQSCSASGVCVANCTPNCSGKNCGNDGCGGSCGTCSSLNVCSSGSCCPTTADIQVCADNQHATYFNGANISSANDWASVQATPVNVIPGKNVIAIKAIDYGGVWGVSATLNRGSCVSMNTNELAKWKCTSNPGSDWTDINYDDSSWPTAITTGGPGIRPGNYLPYNQIWSSDANYAGTTVYCRYAFTAD